MLFAIQIITKNFVHQVYAWHYSARVGHDVVFIPLAPLAIPGPRSSVLKGWRLAVLFDGFIGPGHCDHRVHVTITPNLYATVDALTLPEFHLTFASISKTLGSCMVSCDKR